MTPGSRCIAHLGGVGDAEGQRTHDLAFALDKAEAAIGQFQLGFAVAAAAGLLTLGVAHTYPEALLAGADAVAASLEGLDLDRLERLLAEKSRR